jgi:hypothetical protein
LQAPNPGQNEQSKTNCIKICIKTGNLKLLVLSPCRLTLKIQAVAFTSKRLQHGQRFDYASTVGGICRRWQLMENTHRRTAAILGR